MKLNKNYSKIYLLISFGTPSDLFQSHMVPGGTTGEKHWTRLYIQTHVKEKTKLNFYLNN